MFCYILHTTWPITLTEQSPTYSPVNTYRVTRRRGLVLPVTSGVSLAVSTAALKVGSGHAQHILRKPLFHTDVSSLTEELRVRMKQCRMHGPRMSSRSLCGRFAGTVMRSRACSAGSHIPDSSAGGTPFACSSYPIVTTQRLVASGDLRLTTICIRG